MQRSTPILAAMLTGFAALACATAAQGGVMILPPPGPARIASADAVIVGKVEAIEPIDVKVGTMTYRIAVVKINEGLKGVKDAKTLRVGFVPPPPPPENGKGPFIIRTGARPIQLKAGQEGLFLLKKQAKEDFYTFGGYVGYFIDGATSKDFDKEIEAAKAASRVTENPQAALKAKAVGERLLAAAVLIDQYRKYRGPKSKQEPIDAEESKQILQTLADADWQAAPNFASLRPSPMQLFQRLGVTAKEGFMLPPGANYQVTAQNWLRDHAEKYRIQRFVEADAK